MKNTLLKISGLLLMATVIGCGNSTEKEDNEISVNGMIDVPPQGNISINIPYGGFLKFTEMLPGSRVKKGQLLAVIENPEFVDIQQEYLESLAEGDFLKTEFDRQKTLYEEQVSSAKVFQQAK